MGHKAWVRSTIFVERAAFELAALVVSGVPCIERALLQVRPREREEPRQAYDDDDDDDEARSINTKAGGLAGGQRGCVGCDRPGSGAMFGRQAGLAMGSNGLSKAEGGVPKIRSIEARARGSFPD